MPSNPSSPESPNSGMSKAERAEFNDANRPFAKHVKVVPVRDKVEASSACPICELDGPHAHTPEEVAEAKRPDGSWRRRRPKHPYDACTLEMISIAMSRTERRERQAHNKELLQKWEAEMAEWRKNG